MNTIANNCKVWLWDWGPDLAQWEAPRTKAPLFSDDLVPSKTLSLPSFKGTGSLDWQFCKKKGSWRAHMRVSIYNTGFKGRIFLKS